MNIINNYLTLISLKQEKGFTLIELLVVILFVGILSAIGLPSLINQVNKAKESESLIIIGTLARAQQAYHWEYGEFTDQFTSLGVNFNAKYHTVSTSLSSPPTSFVELEFKSPAIRDYAAGVYANSGNYATYICQAASINSTVEVQNTDPYCNNGGKQLK